MQKETETSFILFQKKLAGYNPTISKWDGRSKEQEITPGYLKFSLARLRVAPQGSS